jgi:hypothetical protein
MDDVPTGMSGDAIIYTPIGIAREAAAEVDVADGTAADAQRR